MQELLRHIVSVIAWKQSGLARHLSPSFPENN